MILFDFCQPSGNFWFKGEKKLFLLYNGNEKQLDFRYSKIELSTKKFQIKSIDNFWN